MSSEVVHPPPSGGNNNSNSNSNNKRKRGHNKGKQKQRSGNNNLLASSYQNIAFRNRPSSGRPGSPHRYFEHSYDVLFNTAMTAMPDADTASCAGKDNSQAQAQNSNSKESEEQLFQTQQQTQIPHQSSGNQVVHRHLNGLCIVTAGSVLEKKLLLPSIHTSSNNKEEESANDDNDVTTITSLQYLVKASKDSQSARGKMRTKNKKQKKQKQKTNDDYGDTATANEDHDGNVLPNDPLCRITLSNGRHVTLKCCVSGTILELNKRLEEACGTDNDGGGPLSSSSLVVQDPLLDGHLAVIMPTKGAFPL